MTGETAPLSEKRLREIQETHFPIAVQSAENIRSHGGALPWHETLLEYYIEDVRDLLRDREDRERHIAARAAEVERLRAALQSARGHFYNLDPDLDADPFDKSPEDLMHHIAGLGIQEIDAALLGESTK